MRLSVRRGDSGYPLWCHVRQSGKRALVKFNGEPEFSVVTADTEAGVLVRLKCDDAGKFVVDRDRQQLVDEVLHGRVEIELVDEETL